MRHLLFLITFCCWSIYAATYYIAPPPTGNNTTGSGTIGAPWATIKKGVDSMSAGDTLIMRGGIYEEASIDWPMSRLSGPSNAQRTTLKSYDGERAIFYPTTHTMHGINAAKTGQTSSNLTFSGFTIDFRRKNIETQGKLSIECFKMYWVTNLTLTNMHFLNNTNGSLTMVSTGNGIPLGLGQGGNIHVVDCLFSNMAVARLSDGHKHDPAHPMYWKTANDVLVERNTFYGGAKTADNNQMYGLHVYDESAGPRGERWIVRNNFFSGFTSASAYYVRNSHMYNNVWIGLNGHGIGQYSQYTMYANNTVVADASGNTGAGIFSFGYHDSFVNNIVWGPFGQNIRLSTSGTANRFIRFTNNIVPPGTLPTVGNPYYEGTTFTNPQFVNSPTDLNLSAGSPAIKTGVDLSSIFTTDYTGATRVTPWDRGAYAFESVPSGGDTYYVATTGADGPSVDGSYETPWRTLAHAITRIAAGDTITIQSGTYDDTGVTMAALPSGTSAGAPTKIVGSGSPVLRYAENSDNAFILFSAASAAKSNVWFEGLVFDGSRMSSTGDRYMLNIAHGSNVTITNCTFRNSYARTTAMIGLGWEQSSVGVDGLLVSGCLFTNWASSGAAANFPPHAIYAKWIRNAVIEDNVFESTGISESETQTKGSGALHFYTGTASASWNTNVVARRNRIKSNVTCIFWWNPRGTNSVLANNVAVTTGTSRPAMTMFGATNTWIANNTIYGGQRPLLVEGGANTKDNRVVNNIFWSGANSISVLTGTGINYWTNNIQAAWADGSGVQVTSQSISADPLFHDPPDNLVVSFNSPAAGTGVNLSSIFTTDFNNETRATWDRGAYNASGQTIYVSTSGHDTTGEGTLTSPYKTIRKGMDTMSPGGTLILRGGTYIEPTIPASAIKSGPSDEQRTIIKSYPGERAVFRCSDVTGVTAMFSADGASNARSNIVLDGWTMDLQLHEGDKAHLKMTASNVTLTNMWFINSLFDRPSVQFSGQTTYWCSNILTTSCTWSNNTGQAWYSWHIMDSVFEKNVIIDGATRSGGAAIQYSGDDWRRSLNLTFRNNQFLAGNNRYLSAGIYANGVSTNTWIYNNLFVNIQAESIRISGTSNFVYNNTIYRDSSPGGTPYGIYVRGGRYNYIANNIAWGNWGTGYPLFMHTDTTAWLSNNILGTSLPWISSGGVITYILPSTPYHGPGFDPLFTDAPSDLTISNTGAAAGTGINLSSVFTTDITGSDRQQWDIGAYKVISTGVEEPPEEPPTPTIHRISVIQNGPAFEEGPIPNTFTIYRDHFTEDLPIEFTLTGTAELNVNYTISDTSPITIPNGNSTVTVTITPINVEYIGSRTVILTIDDDPNYTVTVPSSATMEIFGSGQEQSGFRRTFGGPSRMRTR